MKKVKVRNVTTEDLQQLKNKQLDKAKNAYAACPFATKVYLCLLTKLPYDFISSNWDKITK